MHGAGVLPGGCIDQHHLPAAGLGVRTGYSSEAAKNGKSRPSGNFSDCFERRHAGPMTAYRVVRFPNPIVPMKQFAQRKRLGRWR